MRILFVCSANSGRIAPFIGEQAASLEQLGHEITLFTVKGRGIRGYLANLGPLRQFIRQTQPAIVHAHYGLTGFICVLACVKVPLIVSFMGSDLHGSARGNGLRDLFVKIPLRLAALVVQVFASAIIVKSEGLKKYITWKSKSAIIPNGVDTETFRPIDEKEASELPDSRTEKQTVLFLGNPQDTNKNFRLLQNSWTPALQVISELSAPYPVTFSEVPVYLNSCHVLVSTSLKEGSSNVIKEAMACGIPVVATPAGDAEWLFSGLEGHYLCSYDPADVAEKIRLALEFSATKGRTTGRQRILELGLDLRSVALRIQRVYESVCP